MCVYGYMCVCLLKTLSEMGGGPCGLSFMEQTIRLAQTKVVVQKGRHQVISRFLAPLVLLRSYCPTLVFQSSFLCSSHPLPAFVMFFSAGAFLLL